MSTTRERREARAARLNEWADKREAKAAAEHRNGDLREEVSGIPMGQPILAGHHSQRRHENAIEKANAASRRAIDNSDKASEMRSKAANIEAAAANAIYSDDEDAVDRLRERIAQLEAQRAGMKAANAAFRKQHSAALKAMDAYERGEAVPYPSYALANLSGKITRNRQRLADLERTAA